jgi:hypothetical protein
MESVENMINKYFIIYTNSISKMLLNDELSLMENPLRMTRFDDIKYLVLINSINKKIIDRKHVIISLKQKYNIYVFNNISIKYNYIPVNKLCNIDNTYNNFNDIIHETIRNLNDNIIYLEDFPNILLYKNILFISKKKYEIITNSTNNLINLLNYNLQNGFLLKDSDDKIYFFLIINSNFINLFNKNNYWINNNINIEFNIESNYYLIELHYSYLFPIINEDIQIKDNLLNTLLLCLNNVGSKVQDETKKQLAITLKSENYIYNEDVMIRAVSAGAIGSLAAYMSDAEFDLLVNDIFDFSKYSGKNWKYLQANCMVAATVLQHMSTKIIGTKYDRKYLSFITACINSDKVSWSYLKILKNFQRLIGTTKIS